MHWLTSFALAYLLDRMISVLLVLLYDTCDDSTELFLIFNGGWWSCIALLCMCWRASSISFFFSSNTTWNKSRMAKTTCERALHWWVLYDIMRTIKIFIPATATYLTSCLISFNAKKSMATIGWAEYVAERPRIGHILSDKWYFMHWMMVQWVASSFITKP